jgi:hypothetical protein
METLPLIVYGRAHVLFMLFVFVCVYYLVSNTYCVVFFYFDCLRLVYPMFPVSLDCSFLIVPSVFSNVYLYCLYIVGTHAGDTKSGTGHCIIWSEVVERNCLWSLSFFKFGKAHIREMGNIEASNNSLKHVLEGEGIVQFRSWYIVYQWTSVSLLTDATFSLERQLF